MLLHIAAGLAVLTIVRLPVATQQPDEQAVALVFAARPVLPEPLASPDLPTTQPAASPAPPQPVALASPADPEPPAAPPEPMAPRPPAEPLLSQALPEAAPPPATAEAAASLPPPPATRPSVPHKTTARARPTASPRVAEPAPSSPPPPSDAPVGQPGTRTAETPISGEWQTLLATWLAAHKTYPDEARRKGTEGSLVLRLTVHRSGRVLDVVLVRSAGSSLLDAAAEAMVRNAVLPPFTAGMSHDTATATVQLRYSLTK